MEKYESQIDTDIYFWKNKMMFETLAKCSVGLKTLMDESATNRSSIDIKEILARFTTDIIGSVAFGLDCNSLKDPDALLRKYGKKILAATPLERVKLVVQFGVPRKVLKMFKFKMINPDVENFFMKAVKDTVEHREKNNIYRKDFKHLLIPYVRKFLSMKMVFTPEQKNIFMMNLIFAMVTQFTHF
jgi:cytochrome P450 family 6